MRIAVYVVAALAAVVVIVVAIGYALPVRHTASRERLLPASPQEVFAILTSPADYPRWRSGVTKVEILPDVNGKPGFRETGNDGTITFVLEEMLPDSRIVIRIADTGLPFGGSWTYELEPQPSGTLLRITERGEVYNPLFRFMSRFIMGHHRTIDIVLRDLEDRLRMPRTLQ